MHFTFDSNMLFNLQASSAQYSSTMGTLYIVESSRNIIASVLPKPGTVTYLGIIIGN